MSARVHSVVNFQNCTIKNARTTIIRSSWFFWIFGVLCLQSIGNVANGDDDQSALDFFESKVRPLLVEHCYQCHSGDAVKSKKLKGGLRVDGLDFLKHGGDSGAAIVPNKPDESLLIQSVRWESFEMPPKGKLKKQQIDILTQWIELGAPWPKSDSQNAEANQLTQPKNWNWDQIRGEHWSLKRVTKPELPQIKNLNSKTEWIQNEIDHFVLAKLESNGLSPASPAKANDLARRIYFDLIGLPPTPEQVNEFQKSFEKSKKLAVKNLVDSLLENPQYGERWGRYWLDVARYSDGYGGFNDNRANGKAFHYRDWVVDSFNKDLRYDQFLKMQIAGDLMDAKKFSVATGFFALGPTYNSDGGDPDSKAQAQSETLDDRIDTLTRGMLGLTVSCARCHDHKFDPIPQMDYYSLAGVFRNSGIGETPIASDAEVKEYNDHQHNLRETDKQRRELEDKIKRERREPTKQESETLIEVKKKLANLKRIDLPKYEFVHALRDTGSADMHVAIRGDLRKKGELAKRRFLRAVEGGEPSPFSDKSGRLGLAESMVDSSNPLTARVLVNRVWMHHFDKAIVRTPSNFGKLGEEPTHPKLLDWLAWHFVKEGWSIKELHRTIMNSSTYQMSTEFDPAKFNRDGDNKLIWRMNPRRLDIEAWRDAILQSCGELDLRMGGPPTDDVNQKRRTIYFKVSRNGDVFRTDELLRLFDFPLMRATVAKRPTSIVPQQYLFMLNSSFMRDRAKQFVNRLEKEVAKSEADLDQAATLKAMIEMAYQILYSRNPTQNETSIGVEFLTGSGKEKPRVLWERYAQVLLSSNEFMYVQ